MTDEQRLNFSFFTEGRFFHKAQVFDFKIEGLQPKANVGLTRDVLIPIYSLIKHHFVFLDFGDGETSELYNYKGQKGSDEKDNLLLIEGAIQGPDDTTKEDHSIIEFQKKLITSFNRYQDGNIVYDLSWGKSPESDPLGDSSIEEILVGVAVFISRFRFALAGYAKTGFSYRVFNVPAQVFDFEISMEETFQINFKLEKGTPLSFLKFLSNLFDLIGEVFSLEEGIVNQLSGIDQKLQRRLGDTTEGKN